MNQTLMFPVQTVKKNCSGQLFNGSGPGFLCSVNASLDTVELFVSFFGQPRRVNLLFVKFYFILLQCSMNFVSSFTCINVFLAAFNSSQCYVFLTVLFHSFRISLRLPAVDS